MKPFARKTQEDVEGNSLVETVRQVSRAQSGGGYIWLPPAISCACTAPDGQSQMAMRGAKGKSFASAMHFPWLSGRTLLSLSTYAVWQAGC